MTNSFRPSGYLSQAKAALALLAFLALLLLVYFQPEFADSLQYQRSNFSQEIWRGFSHALPHVNAQHLSLNILALMCIYALFNEAFQSLGWLFALAFSAMASAVGMYWLSPATEWCVGLSGALHGLIVYAALRARASIFWLLAILAKLIVEQTRLFSESGLVSMTADYIGHTVIVDAHLWGAVGGFVFYLLVHFIQYIAVFIEINSSRS